MKPFLQQLRSRLLTKDILRGAAIGLVIFALINVSIGLVYKNRLYPNSKVGKVHLGSMVYSKLTEHIPKKSSLPAKLTLLRGKTSVMIPSAGLGIRADYKQTASELQDKRSWLPIANFFTSHTVPLQLSIDEPVFEKQFTVAAKTLSKPPANAMIVNKNGVFAITNEANGYVFNNQVVQQQITKNVGAGRSTIILPAQVVAPKVKRNSTFTSELKSLQEQQKTLITVRYENKSQKYTPANIADWFATTDNLHYTLSDSLIKNAVLSSGSGFGITVQNWSAAVSAIKTALQNRKALDFTLIAAPKAVRSFTYCVNTKGVDASYLPELYNKLASAYADNRGWSLGGQVSFSRVPIGCNFTVWLAAADQVPTFGAICDNMWSCTVSPNVIINFDRWRYASDSWNAAHGSLDDYRSMVINHETGHWLGFDHKFCGGAGQPAPVMQQQSISLQGCTFNPWPLASEQAELRARFGI